MVQIEVVDTRGKVVERMEVLSSVWDVPMNVAVVHQALTIQRANARQGNANTKTRAMVSGGGRKPWIQKGTGRARQGSIRAPHWRGGGVIFGPRPRSFRRRIPKAMRRLSLRCLLSAKLREGELVVVKGLSLERPKTREMAQILGNLGVEPTILLVTEGPDTVIYKSVSNLRGIKALPAYQLNAVDLTSHRKLVMTVEAVKRVHQLWGGEGETQEPEALEMEESADASA